jgi:hypothetical protein
MSDTTAPATDNARAARIKRASTAALIRASGRTDLTRAERRRLASGVVRKDRPGRAIGGR